MVLSACLGIVGAAIEKRADRAEASLAARRIGRRATKSSRFRRRVHHRADDAVGAGVEHFHQDAGLEPRHAHERHGRRRRDRCQRAKRGAVVAHAVLHVDGQAVPALMRHRLGGEGMRDGNPAVDDGLAARPDLTQAVRSHAAFDPSALRTRGMTLARASPSNASPRRRSPPPSPSRRSAASRTARPRRG